MGHRGASLTRVDRATYTMAEEVSGGTMKLIHAIALCGALCACGSTTTSTRGSDLDDAATSDATSVPRCVPGMEVACACIDGRSGAQRCAFDGTYAPCVCATPAVDAGEPRDVTADLSLVDAPADRVSPSDVRVDVTLDAPDVLVTPDLLVTPDVPITPDVPAADIPAVDVAPPSDVIGVDVPSAPSVTLSTGTDLLINAFAVPEGIIVVHAGYVAVVDRAGAELRRWTPPREITAAAFDGTWLAVADRAMLNVLTASLELRGSGALTDSCVTGVIISGPRFVCGPAADWDRVFYVHELPSGRRLSSAGSFTYEGTPMRRVPGRDDFTTVTTNLSPSDIYLKRVTAENTVVSFRDSPYHGDFAITDTYAFVGDPATHVVTVGGLLLQIYVPGCDTPDAGFRGTCFTRDGTLGTLRTGERFVALTEVSPSSIAGLVDTSASSFDAPCTTGCAVQRIDVTGRAVTSTRMHTISSLQRVIFARHDPYGDRLLLGYSTGDRFGMATGHRLLMLAY